MCLCPTPSITFLNTLKSSSGFMITSEHTHHAYILPRSGTHDDCSILLLHSRALSATAQHRVLQTHNERVL